MLEDISKDKGRITENLVRTLKSLNTTVLLYLTVMQYSFAMFEFAKFVQIF